MINVTIEIEGMEEILSLFKRLENMSVPPSFWGPTLQGIKASQQEKMSRVTSFNVSKKTIAWRKKMYFKDRSVETFLGQQDPVLNSPRVGKRTGVLVKSIRSSDPRGIKEIVQSSEEIQNGALIYYLDAQQYARGGRGIPYPIFFENYLIERGILGEGETLTQFTSDKENYFLDIMTYSFNNHLDGVIGSAS